MSANEGTDPRVQRAVEQQGDYAVTAMVLDESGAPAYYVTKKRDLTTYKVSPGPRCTCVNFQQQGGRCKHIRIIGLQRAALRKAGQEEYDRASGNW